eukprot:m.41911 g.41911  ORF g.41911 m.41911 type:complete len:326 (+) comp33299_c0_seq2:1934-2911(+)
MALTLIIIRILLSVTTVVQASSEVTTCKCSTSDCSSRNYTCRTTGQCFFHAILKNGEWTTDYYCDESKNPELASHCGTQNSDWIVKCCGGEMCNEQFSAPIRPTTANDVNESQTNVVIFVVAGVSVFVMILLTVVILVIFLKYHRTHRLDLERQMEEGHGQGGGRTGNRARSASRNHRRRGRTLSRTRHCDQDAQAYCQCCKEQNLSQSLDSHGNAKNHKERRSSSEPPRRLPRHPNSRQKYMTTNNKTAYSIRGEFSRPPFAVQVDPESQSPIPSNRHRLQMSTRKTNDHSSSTGSGDSTGSWLSTDSKRPITKKKVHPWADRV